MARSSASSCASSRGVKTTATKRRRTRSSAPSDEEAPSPAPASPPAPTLSSSSSAGTGSPAATLASPLRAAEALLPHPLVDIAVKQRDKLARQKFGAPVTHIYNPYDYALETYATYCTKFGTARDREVLLLGMNPGPFGMAQTGVPFGEVSFVRDWMQITGEVGKPAKEHPQRRIEGFACSRSEVSGTRLWGWARDTFGSADAFFARFFVANYCPLVFMEGTGKNRTPDNLPANKKRELFEPCDEALRSTILYLRPKYVVGIGKFAKERAAAALEGLELDPAPIVSSILHPSPASPAANKDWVGTIRREFADMGVVLPSPPVAAAEVVAAGEGEEED